MVNSKPFQPVNPVGNNGGDMAFLSQPTYFYGNDSTNTPSALGISLKLVTFSKPAL